MAPEQFMEAVAKLIHSAVKDSEARMLDRIERKTADLVDRILDKAALAVNDKLSEIQRLGFDVQRLTDALDRDVRGAVERLASVEPAPVDYDRITATIQSMIPAPLPAKELEPDAILAACATLIPSREDVAETVSATVKDLLPDMMPEPEGVDYVAIEERIVELIPAPIKGDKGNSVTVAQVVAGLMGDEVTRPNKDFVDQLSAFVKDHMPEIDQAAVNEAARDYAEDVVKELLPGMIPAPIEATVDYTKVARELRSVVTDALPDMVTERVTSAVGVLVEQAMPGIQREANERAVSAVRKAAPQVLHRGTYDANEDYGPGDEVIHRGSTFRLLHEFEDGEDTAPPGPAWQMIAQGKAGKRGLPGPASKGEPGVGIAEVTVTDGVLHLVMTDGTDHVIEVAELVTDPVSNLVGEGSPPNKGAFDGQIYMDTKSKTAFIWIGHKWEQFK